MRILLALVISVGLTAVAKVWMGVDWMIAVALGLTYGVALAAYLQLARLGVKQREIGSVPVVLFIAIVGYAATVAVNSVSGIAPSDRLGLQMLVFGAGVLGLVIGLLGVALSQSRSN